MSSGSSEFGLLCYRLSKKRAGYSLAVNDVGAWPLLKVRISLPLLHLFDYSFFSHTCSSVRLSASPFNPSGPDRNIGWIASNDFVHAGFLGMNPDSVGDTQTFQLVLSSGWHLWCLWRLVSYWMDCHKNWYIDPWTCQDELYELGFVLYINLLEHSSDHWVSFFDAFWPNWNICQTHDIPISLSWAYDLTLACSPPK